MLVSPFEPVAQTFARFPALWLSREYSTDRWFAFAQKTACGCVLQPLRRCSNGSSVAAFLLGWNSKLAAVAAAGAEAVVIADAAAFAVAVAFAVVEASVAVEIAVAAGLAAAAIGRTLSTATIEEDRLL